MVIRVVDVPVGPQTGENAVGRHEGGAPVRRCFEMPAFRLPTPGQMTAPIAYVALQGEGRGFKSRFPL
jgi:hypothetical protein